MRIKLILFPLLLALGLLGACGEETGPQLEVEKCGCIDPEAINYEPEATCADSSCLYFDEDVKNLNILFTSTGCGACGIWGINCFEGYTDSMRDLAIPLSVHFKYGDPMITPTNDSFVARIKPTHSPYFTVGTKYSQRQGGDRPQSCQLSGQNAKKLLETWKNEAPLTQLAIGYEEVSNQRSTVHVAARVNKLQQCYLSVYRVQNSMIYTQNAGWRNDIEGWVHQHVLRESYTAFSGVALDSEGDNYQELQLSGNLNEMYENSYLLCVLWQQSNDGSWEVLNAKRTY